MPLMLFVGVTNYDGTLPGDGDVERQVPLVTATPFTNASGQKPIDLIRDIGRAAIAVTSRDVEAAVTGYAQRWKIEELRRVWKSGACRVPVPPERARLGSSRARAAIPFQEIARLESER